jgi:hypothetical protein
MRNVSPQNRPEKWILFVGRNASWRYWPLIQISFGVLLLVLFLLTHWISCAIFSMISAFIALTYFERTIFYRIIKRQQEYIGMLESEDDNPIRRRNK